MTDMQMKELQEQQDALAELYAAVEADPEEYKHFQGLLNLLDGQAELNRCLLEGRWSDG